MCGSRWPFAAPWPAGEEMGIPNSIPRSLRGLGVAMSVEEVAEAEPGHEDGGDEVMDTLGEGVR
jgi:hypothetical protein